MFEKIELRINELINRDYDVLVEIVTTEEARKTFRDKKIYSITI